MDNHYDWGGRGTGGGWLGFAVANAGDVNGDGVEDMLVGEPFYYFDSGRGRAFLISGDTTTTEVREREVATPPVSIRLLQNYPNPFNTQTVIPYEIEGEQRQRVQLSIFDLLGREVMRFNEGRRGAGSYKILWDGKDSYGKEVSSGVYLVRLQVGRIVRMRKLVLIR